MRYKINLIIDYRSFENVAQLKYLETTVTNQNFLFSEDIANRCSDISLQRQVTHSTCRGVQDSKPMCGTGKAIIRGCVAQLRYSIWIRLVKVQLLLCF